MPPCGRRRPIHAGAWQPSGTAGGGVAQAGYGPDNLEIECKAALQKMLKPINYGAINVWMRNHGTKDRKGILLLAEAAVGNNGFPVEQHKAFAALQEPVQMNTKGRHRVSTSVHVSADRQQHDLLRVKSSEEQHDKELVRRRKHLEQFASVPSTDSVSEYYRLGNVPVASEPGAKVLTEDARRGLQRWQVRGPEKNKQETAQICQALRTLDQAVKALPTYVDSLRQRKDGSQGCTECLLDYGAVKQLSRSGNYMRQIPMTRPGAGLSRSMPSLPPAYIHPSEIDDVMEKPGGYVVGLMDCEPLQRMKNYKRNITTKIVNGGATSWTTSYQSLGSGAASPM